MQLNTKSALIPFSILFKEYITDNFEPYLIGKFFNSMEMDLDKKNYNDKPYNEYIHGSAEVVGLMCLKVFVKVIS